MNTSVSMLLMCLSLIYQQYPLCLAWMVCEIGSKWLYSCCFARCCFQDLLIIAYSIFVLFARSFFSMHFVKFQVVQLCNSTDTFTAWKNSCFILSVIDFYMVDNLSITVHFFPICMLTSFSVDEILLTRYTYFRSLPFNEEIALSCLKHITSVLHNIIQRQFLSLPVPDYAAEIWVEQEYLQEVLDHLHSLHQQ